MATAKKPTTTRTEEENMELERVQQEQITQEVIVNEVPTGYSTEKTETGHKVIDKLGVTVREYSDKDCKSEDCAKSYAEKLNNK